MPLNGRSVLLSKSIKAVLGGVKLVQSPGSYRPEGIDFRLSRRQGVFSLRPFLIADCRRQIFVIKKESSLKTGSDDGRETMRLCTTFAQHVYTKSIYKKYIQKSVYKKCILSYIQVSLFTYIKNIMVYKKYKKYNFYISYK